MSKNIFWNPKLAEHEIMGNAMDRLQMVADDMASEVKKSVPEGTVSRPKYKSGKNKDVYWTARSAGLSKGSVRTHADNKGGHRNIRIIVGHRWAYYLKIVEFGTNGNKDKGFFRKAINRGKRRAKNILMGK